jgi:protein disulfide-isomerase A1
VLLSQILSPVTCAEVQKLSSAQFQTSVQSQDFVLATFYAPNLDPLAGFQKELQQAAASLSSPFVTVDCAEEQELCRTYDVSSYPSLRLFKRGDDSIRYRGPRKASEYDLYIMLRD